MKKKTLVLEYKNYGTWSYMVVLRGKKRYMLINHSRGVSVVTLKNKDKK